MKSPSVHVLLVHSGILFLLIAIVSILCHLSFSIASLDCGMQTVVLAALMAIFALIPPLWLEVLIGPSVAGPLAVVLWRLGVLIPAIMFTTHQIDPARKCCQVTILACYLVSLPLESWLLIRQTRQ